MSDDLAPGLYEELVSAALASRLASIEDALVERNVGRPADVADRIAQHLAREVVRAIDAVPEAERVATGIEVARRLIEEIAQHLPRSGAGTATPTDPGSVLSAIGEWRPDGSVRMPGRPSIPLLDTTLLTNAPGEPRLGSQILTEIESADSIDLAMAFVRRSGPLPLVAALRSHRDRDRDRDRGRRLRPPLSGAQLVVAGMRPSSACLEADFIEQRRRQAVRVWRFDDGEPVLRDGVVEDARIWGVGQAALPGFADVGRSRSVLRAVGVRAGDVLQSKPRIDTLGPIRLAGIDVQGRHVWARDCDLHCLDQLRWWMADLAGTVAVSAGQPSLQSCLIHARAAARLKRRFASCGRGAARIGARLSWVRPECDVPEMFGLRRTPRATAAGSRGPSEPLDS